MIHRSWHIGSFVPGVFQKVIEYSAHALPATLFDINDPANTRQYESSVHSKQLPIVMNGCLILCVVMMMK